jgi:fructokinase
MQRLEYYGGIEAGGTKFICAIGTGNGELIDKLEVQTGQPPETIAKVIEFFRSHSDIKSIGIGSFGPVDVMSSSARYGTILNTPKPGWSGINLVREVGMGLNLPVKLQTDTDVAAIGELYHGKALNKASFIYITIGTGIGGSIVLNGAILHGSAHPEMGHMQLPQLHDGAIIQNTCRLHESCFEGFASGKSLEIIYGQKAEVISNKLVWDIEANFIAVALTNILMVLPVELVILGGSVMKHDGLIDMVRQKLVASVNGHIELPNTKHLVVHASSDTIGVLGAIKLATL